jgi:hypothetical protein
LGSDGHYSVKGLVRVPLALLIVPLRGALWGSYHGNSPAIGFTLLGEVDHQVSMVLAWKIHGVANIHLMTQFLTSLDAQPIGSVIPLRYPRCPDHVRVDREG